MSKFDRVAPVSVAFFIMLSFAGASARAEEKAVSDKDLKATVDSHSADLKACLGKHGTATGKVVVTFNIVADGSVNKSDASTHSSNAALDRCIADSFKRWTFPKPKGAINWMSNYPIVFSVPKAAPVGKLEDAEINAVIEPKLPEVKACLDEALKANKDVKGIATLGVVVSPAGVVTEVHVLSTTTTAPKLDDCVAARVKTWAFPKPHGGGEASFSYPFKLNVK
jgi:outer membrane biosynthesis protein TonB